MKKTFKFPIKKDPYYERESKRYKNPIPSREYIMQCMKKIERPLNFRELGKIFGLSLKEVEALRFRLGAMRRDGQVILKTYRDARRWWFRRYLKQKISGGGNLYTREMQLISQYKELNCNQINAGVVER